MAYDVIIIGSGIGGLAAGLKLSCAGKKVMIIEKQPIAGGFATSFQRKGFIFESSLHCVDALGEAGEVRGYLKESGVARKVEFIALKSFMRVIYPGHDFVADFNHNDLKEYLISAFPQERRGISRLFREFDRFLGQFKKFESAQLPYWLQLAISPFIYPSIAMASQLTAAEFLEKYTKDEQLTALLTDIWRYIGLPPSKLSALYYLILFTSYYYEPTAYVKGGYPALIRAIVERIKENGGVLKFNSQAVKIVTRRGKIAQAVVTDDGEIYEARSIISNVNAIDTLSVLPDGEALKNGYRSKLMPMEKSISAFQVYLGLKIPAQGLGMNHFMFSVNAGYDHDANYGCALSGDYSKCPLVLVDHSQLDSGLAPLGKAGLLIMTLDNYANWSGLSPEEYKKKKMEAAAILIKRAEAYLPGLADNIEVMEAATPRTMQRYGVSPDGAIYGFAQTPRQSAISRPKQKTAVKGLFLAGAWTRPGGGAHACFVSGWEAGGMALQYLSRYSQ